jgi:hypothetical protein
VNKKFFVRRNLSRPNYAALKSTTRFLMGWLLALFTLMSGQSATAQASGKSLRGMVLVGYQGWFRCPGDGSPANAWSHWSKGLPGPETMSVDLYPDTSELSPRSLCKLPGESINGKPAYLFSSFPKETVDKHFEWMQNYGIDGVLLQRFTNSIPGLRNEGDVVLRNVRTSAEAHHRVFAVEYDMSGAHADTIMQQLKDDWQYLSTDVHVTSSPAYLRMNGKPVVSLWGFGFNDGHHIVDPVLALQIINWFKNDAHVVVMGGVPAGWGSLSSDSVSDPAWAKVYAALDIVQPWTVGRYRSPDAADSWKTTHLIPDLALTEKNHQLYMPVVFPGFSWHNLNRKSPADQIPRLGGRFLWEQAYNAKTAGASFIKIAMFDEVNEGTAIFKAVPLRKDAPTPGYWLTLDADGDQLPSDWYLRIADKISLMFRGKIAATSQLPLIHKEATAEPPHH